MARPKGIKETKPRLTTNRKLAAQYAAGEEITMPELMRKIALLRWAEGDRDGALIAAEKAAPYFAPKLSSTTATVAHTVNAAGLTDAELDRELAAAGVAPDRVGSGEEAPDNPRVTH